MNNDKKKKDKTFRSTSTEASTGNRAQKKALRGKLFSGNSWQSNAGEEDRKLKIGERLRQLREKKGVSVEAVAHTIKIPVDSLHALEEGNYGKLPAQVYVQGFGRLYAEYLGIDPDEIASGIAKEYKESQEQEKDNGRSFTPRFLRPFRRSSRFRLSPRFTIISLAALVGIIALIYLFAEVRGFTRAPFLEVTKPSSNVEISRNTLTVSGRTDPTAEIRINGEQTFVKSDGTFEETIGVSEGVNTIKITAESVGGKEATITREVLVESPAEEPSPAPDTEPGASSSIPNTITLSVRAKGEPVWISLVVDGEQNFSGILLPDSQQNVSGKEVVLTSGKGNRTEIRIEEGEWEVFSDNPGVERNIVYTPRDLSGSTLETEN